MTEERVPLLILGDSPAGNTGLGRILRDVALRTHMHLGDVFDVATIGWGATPSTDLPFQQYPMLKVKEWLVQDLPYAWYAHTKGREGILLSIWDVSRLLWMVHPEQIQDPEAAHVKDFLLNHFKGKKWIYPAIDGAGPSGGMSVILKDALARFDRVVNYTQFSAYITGYPDALSHGVDTSVFYPRTDAREYIKERIKVEIDDGEFLVGIVATNQPRKDWAMVFGAMALLKQAGYKVRLWIHTDTDLRHWDLKSLYIDFGLQPHVKIFLTPYGLPDEDLAQLYSACDCTIGIGPEGFGYPIAESLCCGTPCITGEYGGQADFVPIPYLVRPTAYRYEGIFAVQRPVYNSQAFADKIACVFTNPEMRSYAKPVCAWDDVWPAWEKWLRSGVSKEPVSLDTVRKLNYAHHKTMTEKHLANESTGMNEHFADLDNNSLRALLLGVPRVNKALELGCASGGQWPVLKEWANTITGIDLYEPAVRKSQEQGLDIHLGFVENMPFHDDQFDLVVSRHVMEHVADIQTALAEIKRVLKPVGIVAAVTPHRFPDLEPAHIQQLRIDEWVNEYRKAGFTILSTALREFECVEAHIVARKSK